MKKIADGNLINIDIAYLQNLDKEVVKNAKTINDLVLEIVKKATSEIDELVFTIKEQLKSGIPLDTEQLEIYALEISTFLYYLGQAQEYIGLRYDVSKAAYKERYGSAYAAAIGTIADKTAQAEAMVNYEFIEQSINERAYKRIKVKVENATELLQTLKKIISRRIAEYELTKVSSADIQSLKQSNINNQNMPNVVRRARRN